MNRRVSPGAGGMTTIYAVVSPHSQIQIKTERLTPGAAAGAASRPLRPVNSADGAPSKARRQLAMNLNKGAPVINNRRNARERNRVKQVNQGFAVLRAHLPAAPKSKKTSKVDTLRGAIDYIHALTELLAAPDEYDSAVRYDSPTEYDPLAGYGAAEFPYTPPRSADAALCAGAVYRPAADCSAPAAGHAGGLLETAPPPPYSEVMRTQLQLASGPTEPPPELHWWTAGTLTPLTDPTATVSARIKLQNHGEYSDQTLEPQ